MIEMKNFLNEEQNPKAVEKVVSKLSSILMAGEEVQYIAVQKKPVVNFSPDCLALTNKRVIVFRPSNFGLSFNFNDALWKDVYDCHFSESILGAEFVIRTMNNGYWKIDYLPKAQARKLYAIAQEQEEIQREIRRQLDLEHQRASAGNVNVGIPNIPSVSAPTQASQGDDPLAALQKLKSLLDAGLLTQQEFDVKKAEIISRL